MGPSVILFSAVFGILVQESFSPVPFCALNMNEKICKKKPRYKFQGTFGNVTNPIFISSPCRVEPIDGLLGQDLKQSFSFCILEAIELTRKNDK